MQHKTSSVTFHWLEQCSPKNQTEDINNHRQQNFRGKSFRKAGSRRGKTLFVTATPNIWHKWCGQYFPAVWNFYMCWKRKSFN